MRARATLSIAATHHRKREAKGAALSTATANGKGAKTCVSERTTLTTHSKVGSEFRLPFAPRCWPRQISSDNVGYVIPRSTKPRFSISRRSIENRAHCVRLKPVLASIAEAAALTRKRKCQPQDGLLKWSGVGVFRCRGTALTCREFSRA